MSPRMRRWRAAQSRTLLTLCRLFAACRSVQLCAMLFSLLMQTRAPHPLPVIAAAVPVLLYTVSRPQSATARTATVLLFLSGIAFLLLPLAALRSANLVSVYMPGSAAAAFRREWLFSGELWLLPLLMQNQTKQILVDRLSLSWHLILLSRISTASKQ